MGYAGWHGIQDHLHQLIAVSYEPIEGHLCCRFHSTDEVYIYVGVPEAKYQTLLKSPYAGSYFRKFIKGVHRCLNEVPPEYKPTGDGPQKKATALAKKRLAEVTTHSQVVTNLFGEEVLPKSSKRS